MNTPYAQSTTRVIRNARILTMDPSLGDFEQADLLISGSRIENVASRVPAPEGAEEIDAKGCIVIPGFVDTHRHMWEALLRGSAPQHTLNEYFQHILREIGPALTPEELRVGNLLSAYAALDSGVTCVQDISNIQDTPAHSDALISALRESGLRAVFSYGLSLPVLESSGTRLPDDVRRIRAEVLHAPAALVTLSLVTEPGDDETERHNADLARDLDVRTARHTFQRPGEQPISRLRDLGALLPGTTFIHGTGLDEDELGVIAEHAGRLSVAPAIEMMMGHGFPPLAEAARAGVPVSLSADVEVTTGADMFTQMRAAYQAGRHSALSQGHGGPVRPGPGVRDILHFATLAGARTLGMDDVTGSLIPGKQADLVVLRADTAAVAPVVDPYSTVVLQMDRSHVDSVFVAGRAVKRHGAFLFDTDAVVESAWRTVRRLTDAGLLPS